VIPLSPLPEGTVTPRNTGEIVDDVVVSQDPADIVSDEDFFAAMTPEERANYEARFGSGRIIGSLPIPDLTITEIENPTPFEPMEPFVPFPIPPEILEELPIPAGGGIGDLDYSNFGPESEEGERDEPDDYGQFFRHGGPVGFPPIRTGGIASLATGGYPRRTGQINGPGTATSDSIPAMLSDGEFVMTAKAVRGAGKGDRRKGAKKMYALMHQLERNASRG
jgi:hypothetical protein